MGNKLFVQCWSSSTKSTVEERIAYHVSNVVWHGMQERRFVDASQRRRNVVGIQEDFSWNVKALEPWNKFLFVFIWSYQGAARCASAAQTSMKFWSGRLTSNFPLTQSLQTSSSPASTRRSSLLVSTLKMVHKQYYICQLSLCCDLKLWRQCRHLSTRTAPRTVSDAADSSCLT